MNSEYKAGKALIIGGGMAGMLAARVLSDLYAEVLIIERDELPEGAANRPGTPQAYHPHRLLSRGKAILEGLFPGYIEELLEHGAYLRAGKLVQIINKYGRLETPDERDAGCSRALLEWVIRQRVQRISNVSFLGMQEVTGLLTTPDQATVTGVHLRERGQTGQRQTLVADLVVDASGSSSKVIRWLQTLGYEAPEAERLKVSLGYSTRHYKIPPHLVDQWSVIWIECNPEQGIATGVFGPIENNIAEVTFYKAGGASYPTTDGAHYEEEAAKLLSPEIADVLLQLEPISEPRGYRVAECVRQHFERMVAWPSGLLVLGDTICNFDPIYGQGITVAAIEAEILASSLRAQRLNPQPNFELGVLQRMQEAIEPVWWLGAVADLRWSGVEYVGAQPLKGVEFTQKYFDLYQKQVYGHYNMDLFEKYFMMTGLDISPNEVINAEMVNAVLAADGSAEAEQLRAEFLSVKGQSLEETLEGLIPHFVQDSMPLSMAQV